MLSVSRDGSESTPATITATWLADEFYVSRPQRTI
jgi:hypothetical protein